MKIDKLKLSKSAISFLKSQGFVTLYPPQTASIKSGLLNNTSLLISAPTASGKTLIAILAILGYLPKHKGKVVYLSPLRALASEKFLEFKKLEEISPKIKVAISTGDYDRVDRGLKSSNVLILTNEKMDAMIRRGDEWIDDIVLIIADEIHLIGNETRGPTLEIVLTQLKQLESNPQIVGLSATVTNSDEIAEWLDCKLVKSDWRPVPLAEGVCSAGRVVMNDRKRFSIETSTRGVAIDLAVQSVSDGGQSLIFAETRPRSKSLATKAAGAVEKLLTPDDITKLNKMSSKILSDNENTELVKTLADLVKKGVAFHHAGLNQNCRTIIEDMFRQGTIKILTSTPTLAAGVNLPARRVVISSVNRYDAKIGMNAPISVLEYKQLCGRAGRPQYDTRGESIIVTNQYLDTIFDHYVKGVPEPIESTITSDRALRTFILAVVSARPGITYDELIEFFSQTLGGIQLHIDTLTFRIDSALRFLLIEELLVKKDGRHAATSFGKKTTMLYIDPETATTFRDKIYEITPKRSHALGILNLITHAAEFFPNFTLREKDYDLADDLISKKSNEQISYISAYNCSRSLLVLDAWINESNYITISDNFGVESGDVHRMVENADWLLYCLREISKHIDRSELLEELDELRRRVKYGIKSELTDLVRVKGIGRVRARRLYKYGIKNITDLRRTSVTKLAKIDKIGSKLATSIKASAQRVR